MVIAIFAFSGNFVTFRPISVSLSLQHYLFLLLIYISACMVYVYI